MASDSADTPLLTPATAGSPSASGTSTPLPGNGKAAAAAVDPLAFMQKLNGSVYLWRRPASASTPALKSKGSAPKFLLVCTWMDARSAHIAKYIAAYCDGQVFADGSVPETILLVRANQSYVFDIKKTSEVVQPALPVVREYIDSLQSEAARTATGSDVQLLTHTFSNGGCFLLSQIYDELFKIDKNLYLPAHVSVFDSCPGKFHYSVTTSAFFVPFQRKPIWTRAVALPIVHMYVLYYWLRWEIIALWTGQRELAQVPGEPNDQAMSMYRAWVPPNNHTAKGGNRFETCRLYIYSPGDKMILAPDVEEHAEEAKAAGFNVARMEKFPDSAHVAHQRADPERYWRAVREVWEGR